MGDNVHSEPGIILKYISCFCSQKSMFIYMAKLHHTFQIWGELKSVVKLQVCEYVCIYVWGDP